MSHRFNQRSYCKPNHAQNNENTLCLQQNFLFLEEFWYNIMVRKKKTAARNNPKYNKSTSLLLVIQYLTSTSVQYMTHIVRKLIKVSPSPQNLLAPLLTADMMDMDLIKIVETLSYIHNAISAHANNNHPNNSKKETTPVIVYDTY